jgi:hypothetical protein
MSRNKATVKAKRERTDHERLELFVEKVNELANTNIAKKGFNVEYTIQGGKDRSIESKLQQPDEADLKEYLVTFRQFISENEDIYLNRIFNICHQRIVNDEVKKHLAEARQIFEGMKQNNGLNIIVNNVQMTPLYITDMYINGKYFHSDIDYQTEIDNMDLVTADVVRFEFVSYVESVTRIIVYVRGTISRAFEDNLFSF